MLRTQEVRETYFHTLNEVPKRIYKKLKKEVCINCENKFPEDGDINYLTTPERIIWWHNWGCIKQNKKFTIKK